MRLLYPAGIRGEEQPRTMEIGATARSSSNAHPAPQFAAAHRMVMRAYENSPLESLRQAAIVCFAVNLKSRLLG